MNHPDGLTIQMFVRNEISLWQQLLLKVHFCCCPDCRHKLEEEKKEQLSQQEFRRGIEFMEEMDEKAEQISSASLSRSRQ